MAQIGTFTRGEDGSYTSTIKTLSLNIKVRFVPAEPSQNEKAPDLRALAGNIEIGAAWKRTSKENAPSLFPPYGAPAIRFQPSFHHGGQDRPALGASRLTIDRSVSTARKESDRAECKRKLDQALELTFPASDPIAVGCPTSTELAMRPALSERVLPTRKHRNVKERQR